VDINAAPHVCMPGEHVPDMNPWDVLEFERTGAILAIVIVENEAMFHVGAVVHLVHKCNHALRLAGDPIACGH